MRYLLTSRGEDDDPQPFEGRHGPPAFFHWFPRSLESVHVSLVFQIVESPHDAFYVTNEFWPEAPWMRIEAMLKEGRVFVGVLPADASW